MKWGILGLGSIADTFANDLHLVPDADLVAVASRSIENAKAFSKKHHSKYAFGSYEDLFNCDEVDVIYIATPHNFHADNAIKAMQFGKHVLCEKPMGVNSEEVERMLAVAKQNKVFLMEALWSRFNPIIRKVKELIDAGTIGDIKYLNADFAFPALDRDVQDRTLNPNLAGGSILDIGIYPIFLAYLLLGKPQEVMAKSKMFKTGVEIQTSMLFDYASAQAVLYSGLNSKTEMKAQISGEKGNILIHPRWHEAEGCSLLVDGKQEDIIIPKIGNGYTQEIEEVHSCLKSSRLESDLWSHQNSRDLITLLDLVRTKAGVKFPFEASLSVDNNN